MLSSIPSTVRVSLLGVACLSILIASQDNGLVRGMMGQAISTTQFYLYGRRHFTLKGYQRKLKKHYISPVQEAAHILRNQEGADSVDMEGKVVVVTGANSGIGKEIATYAAAKGATVYMICRSKDRALQAQEEILQATSTSTDHVKVLLADLGELSHVRRVVSELQAMESKVDFLVCNAGVLLDKRVETSDGNEATFATHLLGGSYLLSQMLLPQLQNASSSPSSSASSSLDQDKARVIFVSSGGMYATKFPEWEIATSSGSASSSAFDGQMAYAYAKRGQVLLAEQLAQKYADIHWMTAHPGWVDTNAVEEAYGSAKVLFKPLRTPWQGAEGITWLMAGARTSELQNGAFYLDRKPQQKHFAGLFFREGSHTRNTPLEVQSMMDRLKEAAQL